MIQEDLFAQVLGSYVEADGKPLGNAALYSRIKVKLSLDESVTNARVKLGKGNQEYNLFKRGVRWFQQTLKHAGVIERVPGERGVWRYVGQTDKEMHQVIPEYSVLAFSTHLGVAILSNCTSFFSKIDEPIHLILSSPPYPLRNPRNYGNPNEAEYVDWICRTIEPLIKNMADGGSLCLNIGNEIFMPGMPARSMYQERLVLALHDRFGLYKMDTLIWHNPTKPPGPIQWASKNRSQFNAAYEPIIWMTNNPNKVLSNNKRVLQPHTEQHKKLIAAGGARTPRSSSDGAYRIMEGAYSNPTEGRIQRNVLSISHNCADQRRYKEAARNAGLPAHGAAMPLRLAKLLVEFLTDKEQLVVDPFAGSFTVPKAAEELLRRWIGTEIMLEYVLGSSSRFAGFQGFRNGLAIGNRF